MPMTLWLTSCGREEGAAAGTSGAAAADAVSLSDEYPVEDFRRAVTDGKADCRWRGKYERNGRPVQMSKDQHN